MSTALGNPARVRVADARDEEELYELCRALHSENALFPMSEPKVRQMLRWALHGAPEERRGIIGVVGDRGRIEGSIYLQVGSIWYSNELYLDEVWNYVRPHFRNSSNSRDLIAFAVAMADHFKVKLTIGILSNIRTQAKVRLYRRQLGEPAGAFFIHQQAEGMH